MTTVFKQVGPYNIIRQIGHGGMAVVFLAVDTRINRHVALKLVQHGSDREAREIVEAEQFGAELQKQFSERGSHVPAVYGYGIDEDSGYFYVAMEYVDGENLSEVIAHGALPPERAADIARDLARFLEDAHDFEAVVNGRNLQSLLHLDLKPRNVRITSSKKVKVLDFGTAKALSLSRKVTRNDFGSVAYLSPERLETGEVDAGADLWALGVVLYEMLKGTPPFQAADTRRLERLILARRPPPSLDGHCPPGLTAIAARLLDPRQAERYASAKEIRADLERFRSGVRTIAEEQGWPARALGDDATRRTTDDATRRTSDDATRRNADVTSGASRSPNVVSGFSRTTADDEKTRRTQPARPAAVMPPPLPLRAPAPADPPQAVARPRPARTWRYRFFQAVLLFIGLGLMANEFSIASEANRRSNAAATINFDGLPAAWDQYRNLVDRSHLQFGTHTLRESLIDRTEILADRVMANYRTPSPTVREAQWLAARDALALALANSGGDRELRAALRICEGHLHRINGEAQKARNDGDGGQEELTEAVVAFREAAELRSEWRDPFLGLARTFISGLEDIELGSDAFAQAQRYGHEMSDRDWALLGDGYRARGNSLVKSAGQLQGLPQERDYLSRAAEAYRLALGEYAKVRGFANVPQNIARTQRALLQVEETLGEGFTALPEEEP